MFRYILFLAVVMIPTLSCQGQLLHEQVPESVSVVEHVGEPVWDVGDVMDIQERIHPDEVGDVMEKKPEKPVSTDTLIKLSFGTHTVIIKMAQNATSRDFLSLLPLTLKLNDYAATEKVATLPRKLSTADAPAGFDPSVGDVTYYSPWGNLAIFYKDFRYSTGLVPLGKIQSGLKDLASLQKETSVLIEKVKK